MWYLVILLAILVYYSGSIIEYCQTTYVKMYTLVYLLKHIKGLNTSEHKGSGSFSLLDTDVCAGICYERLGKSYTFFVPYNRKYTAPMLPFIVHLLNEQGDIIRDITQQPGIPYLVTALHLGGASIKITNGENGMTHTYAKDIIPSYGVEVMDD